MKEFNEIFSFVTRLLAFGSAVAAVALMLTSHDSTTISNLTFHAKYSDTPTFKYFATAQGIVGAYSLVALLCSSKISCRPLLVILDAVVAMLLSSSISAAFVIADVGKNGNSHAGWLPICGQVPKFCDRVNGSLISGFAAAVLYSILLLYSLYSVLSPLKI